MESIDYSALSEYLGIYDNDNSLIQTCDQGMDYGCDIWYECVNN